MKLFRSRALTAVVVIGMLILMIILSVLVSKLYINKDIYKTPYMFLDGEYSIDGGDWKTIDRDKPITDRFHKIVFRGTIPEYYLTYYEKITISTKNIWFSLRPEGEEETEGMVHKSVTLEEYCKSYFSMGGEDDYTEEERQRFISNLLKKEPFRFKMTDTPGYLTVDLDLTMAEEDGLDSSTVFIFECEYPYADKIMGFYDCIDISVSYDNVAYIRIVKENTFQLLVFLLLCFFGIFFFPTASFVLGRLDYRYLTFGILCFFWGLYMIIQNLSFDLNQWFLDPTVCLLIDKMSEHFFTFSILVYLCSNLSHDRTRAAAGIMTAGFAFIVAVAAVLHMTGIADLMKTMVNINVVNFFNVVVMIVLLTVETKHTPKFTPFMVSWLPMMATLIVDILDHFFHITGSHYFAYGLAIAMTFQIVRLIFDMREQYKTAIRYQQIQKELYEARVSVMISQIQPHFMYNALTSIAMMCTLDPKTAQNATIAFAKYLRGNMDSLNQKNPVPFEKELEHLKQYLFIEKLRFDDKLNIVYEITVTDFVLPLLSVQPLVENAVKHGVGMKKKGGTVKILTRETETAYEVIVSDDGAGFDTSAPPKNDGRSHVGMDNTRTRLKEMCGGEVIIESTVGAGTTAKIILPKEGQASEDTVS